MVFQCLQQVLFHLSLQEAIEAGLVPALDRDSADVITGSEDIVKAFAVKHSLTATAIVDLIKNVLKNPAFNSDEVDTDMLQRLQASIDSGDLEIISSGCGRLTSGCGSMVGHFRASTPWRKLWHCGKRGCRNPEQRELQRFSAGRREAAATKMGVQGQST
uniref:Uncharacterized protein n=1 Tax=Cryptomonas curvata TaxID=233186 RepID=A0A7S0QUG1_9CRYP|mmetsp:Transcript_56506/g.118133  ORF Transcript_56506/g.118133 Transcript_56506/m.118133 type:complete len:160 (+) Transcript_56506:591-1070(+)